MLRSVDKFWVGKQRYCMGKTVRDHALYAVASYCVVLCLLNIRGLCMAFSFPEMDLDIEIFRKKVIMTRGTVLFSLLKNP